MIQKGLTDPEPASAFLKVLVRYFPLCSEFLWKVLPPSIHIHLQDCCEQVKCFRERFSKSCCLVFCTLLGLVSIKEQKNPKPAVQLLMEYLHAAASIHLYFPGSLLTHFFSSVKEDLKNQLQPQQKLQFRQYHSSADLSDSPRGHQNIDNRQRQFCHDHPHVFCTSHRRLYLSLLL